MACQWRLILMALLFPNLYAWAAEDSDGYIRLARVSYLEGTVSFQPYLDTDWSAASLNLPLQPGDRLYTGPGGRAEIEFDEGSVWRLAENTDVEVLALSENLIQLRILVGLCTLSIRSSTDFEINTPAAAFNALRAGKYRFDVVEDGNTDAIVRKGELQAASNRFSRRIEPGHLLHVTPGEFGTDDLSHYDRQDIWDEWNDRRDLDRSLYVNGKSVPDSLHIGVSELERYGRWVTVESYGTAWVPLAVDASWSPYSVGRWCYRPSWGWTWISYEPWGWLPYHYGRWYRSSSLGWCWLPGPAFAFNFWSPGLVAFYSGPGWISWCPLGPGDYYAINNYYYNRRIHGNQLDRLHNLHTRGPSDPFNRHAHGAFRTVEIEQFRNGSFRDRDIHAGWRSISQPWREGVRVHERLAVQPTSISFRADPDRPSIRPRIANPMPSIVRSVPANRDGIRGRVIGITNPQLPSRPAVTSPVRDNSGSSEGRNRPNPDAGRIHGARPRDRDEVEGTTVAGSDERENREGRRMDSSHRSGRREDDKDRSLDSRPPAPASRTGRPGSINPQDAFRPRDEGQNPARRGLPQNHSDAGSRGDNNRRDNAGSSPRSSGAGAPDTGRGTITTPRPTGSSGREERNNVNRSKPAPPASPSGGINAPSTRRSDEGSSGSQSSGSSRNGDQNSPSRKIRTE
jgi:hypothetical protein